MKNLKMEDCVELSRAKLSRDRVAVVGCSSGLGGYIKGAGDGPEIIRHRGLLSRLTDLGLDVSDRGNVDAADPEEYEEEFKKIAEDEEKINGIRPVYAACRRLRDRVAEALQEKRMPLVLGGDHSLSIGSVAALGNHHHARGERVGLIWIDTHPDLNAPHTSPSGNAHGMSVAYLSGIASPNGLLASLLVGGPAVRPENIAYVGLRDVDSGERRFIKELGIKAYTMSDVDRYGMGAVMERAIHTASRGTAGFAVSFDLDVCDPKLAPGTGTPMRGGLTFRESHLAIEMAIETGRTLLFEIVELNPSLDLHYTTADLAVSLLQSAAGETIM